MALGAPHASLADGGSARAGGGFDLLADVAPWVVDHELACRLSAAGGSTETKATATNSSHIRCLSPSSDSTGAFTLTLEVGTLLSASLTTAFQVGRGPTPPD